MSDYSELQKAIEVLHGTEIAILTDANNPKKALQHKGKVNAYATVLRILNGGIEVEETEKNQTYMELSKAMQQANRAVAESKDEPQGIGVQ